MSLLREAERCLSNQKLYSTLNAFIAPLQGSAQTLDRVRDADLRRDQGKDVKHQGPVVIIAARC